MTKEPTGGDGEGTNKPRGVKPTAPTRPMETGEPTGEDTVAVMYEPTEEDPVEELTSRPTQKPTIDDIGKGTDSPTGGLIKEPPRVGLGMDLFGLATDDGGELDKSGVLMGNDGGAADHPAVHRPVVHSPERLCRHDTPQKNPIGCTNESSRVRQMKP